MYIKYAIYTAILKLSRKPVKWAGTFETCHRNGNETE